MGYIYGVFLVRSVQRYHGVPRVVHLSIAVVSFCAVPHGVLPWSITAVRPCAVALCRTTWSTSGEYH